MRDHVHVGQGSSPRMRGTPFTPLSARRCAGIIPAYAGNTGVEIEMESELGDHPRVCGEHGAMRCVPAIPRGSSPRMRGTHSRGFARSARTGIIPAYAGNTSNVRSSIVSAWDHPRVCGEHVSLIRSVMYSAGSSPRMRGTPFTTLSRVVVEGIIPAYAGNTCVACSYSVAYRDHPRVCGEHRVGDYEPVFSAGSSPRMRGTH